MKTQILPNWCKKLGLIIFIISLPIGFGQDFFNGLNGLPYKTEGIITAFVGGKFTTHFFNILAIIGMLIYMLSKEKIEDDYINILRLESFQLTAIVGLFVSILLFSFSKDVKLTLDYFIFLFIWVYITAFFIKKRVY